MECLYAAELSQSVKIRYPPIFSMAEKWRKRNRYRGYIHPFVLKSLKLKNTNIKSCLTFATWQLQKGALCADTVVGQGNSTAWKMCGLDRNTSFTVFFDVSPSERSSQPVHQNSDLYTVYNQVLISILLSLF